MILVKRDYEVLEHMVFPVLVLGLLGLACEIDAQNFIIEYFAHCRYQLVIDDLLLRICHRGVYCRNPLPQCVDQLVNVYVLFFRQRQAGVFVDEKIPGRMECLFRIGQDVIYIDCEYDALQILAPMFYLNGHRKRRDVYVSLADVICLVFLNDVEFPALAEEKAAFIRSGEGITFFLHGGCERWNSRKFYWSRHRIRFFVIWSQNRKKGYKAQIIYNIPFDNRTNRIMNKQN